MAYKIIVFLLPFFVLMGQESAVKKTGIYLDSSGSNEIGTINEGVRVQKLEKTTDGKFIKATADFYIPVDNFEDPDIYASIGTRQRSGDTFFNLKSARISGNKVRVQLEISNNGKSDLKFTAAVLTKLTSSGVAGGLNPFEGRNQGFAVVKPKQTIQAELIYDFKSEPSALVFMCKETMNGPEVQYSVK